MRMIYVPHDGDWLAIRLLESLMPRYVCEPFFHTRKAILRAAILHLEMHHAKRNLVNGLADSMTAESTISDEDLY